MAIEPLAELLRIYSQFRGLQNGSLEEKVSLCADDMLLYVSDPLSSVPITLKIIQEFGQFSGFSINWRKYCIFPIDEGLPLSLPLDCPSQLTHCFKYLEIHIQLPLSTTLMVTANKQLLLRTSVLIR